MLSMVYVGCYYLLLMCNAGWSKTHSLKHVWLNFCFLFAEHSVRSHGDFTIVHPEKVDGDGRFISHTLSHHFVSSRRRRREVDIRNSQRVYYKLNFSGWDLTLNLTINDNLLASGYVFEQRMKNRSESERVVHRENECHLIGTVTDGDVEGTAAFSSCNGLVSTENRKWTKSQVHIT